QVTGTVFGLGPSPAYASGLSGVMTKLASARSGAQTQLASAKTPAHQASAANHVSAAYRQAAGSVQKPGPAPSAQDANAAIAAARGQPPTFWVPRLVPMLNPAMDPALQHIDTFMSSLDGEVRQVAPGEWGLVLEAAGYVLDVGVSVRGALLRAQAAVLPAG